MFSFILFISSNIKKWIIRECLKSGDPENFFWAIQDAIDEIVEDKYDDPEYWDEIYGEWMT